MKKFFSKVILLLLCFLFMLLLFSCVRINSKKDFYESKKNIDNETIKIEINIVCDTIKDYYKENEFIPIDGKIVSDEILELNKNATVYDALIECIKSHNIHIDKSGDTSYGMVYIKGLNHIYEYDYGDLSGWVYHVDGVEASVGCAEYKLKGGEVISWIYTKELGHDIKDRIR